MTDSTIKSAEYGEPLTVCVVSHTHWDREWYHSAGRFRQGLVALVDALLERPVGASPFLLDGQAIVLEDYLQVRPERASAIRERLQTGALEAGPWYVLADGLIPSGEALVRNLLAGTRIVRRLGGAPPAVAYCPDTFGHSHAIPTIAEGFGFPIAIVWRGYGSSRAPRGDTVRWWSENGSSVILYHLPPDGYETGSALPADRALLAEKWKALRAMYGTRANSGIVLLPNGADHHALQPDIAQVTASLAEIARPDVVVASSLSEFAVRLVNAASEIELPSVRGELRDSYGYTWTLGGTYGTRAYQKRANARAERLLLRDVEPWFVLAWLHGDSASRTVAHDGRITLAQAPALMDQAWRTLLKAHPHDTLCGCSIDAVARAMDVQLESAMLQGKGLRSAALNIALNHDVVSARSKPIGESHLVIRNRESYARGGLAEIILDETIGDVPVGPSSAIKLLPNSPNESSAFGERLFGMPAQLLSSRERYRRRESPQHYPDNDRVLARRALILVPQVPALGVTVAPSTADSAHDAEWKLTELARLKVVPGQVATLSNGRVALNVRPDSVTFSRAEPISNSRGSVEDGKAIHGISIETVRDVGDSYTPAIRGSRRLLRMTAIETEHNGPLRASLTVQFETRGKRNKVKVQARFSVDAASDFVRVDLRGVNRRKNHRLRLNFHTGISNAHHAVETFADAAFGPVRRDTIVVPLEDQQRETVPDTMPMHRWVTLSSAHGGATLHSDGLAEVEANEKSGTISLTLLRAIGELSRNNLRERPGHAGWPASIPLAQSQGEFRASVALQLHDAWSAATRDKIERASDNFLLPLTGFTMRDLSGEQTQVGGPALSGSGLRVSCVKLAEDGDGIVLRCVNDSPDATNGEWRLPQNAQYEFAAARMDETPACDWQPLDGIIAFISPARAVTTFRVRHRANLSM